MDWQVPIYDGTTQRGVLTAQRQGLRTIFHVRCPKWGEGVYKIWLQGEREALLLGTLVPEGEVFTLERSISNAMLREKGVEHGSAAMVVSEGTPKGTAAEGTGSEWRSTQGLELPALEEYPDSCFVEDPAVITRCGAIITNPGADSRNGEKDEIEPTIRQFFDDEHVKHIVAPGTLDGGDVMMVGDHFYVGRSARTNEEGIRQFIEILEGWGLEGSEVPLEEVLHLKTGVNYLEDGNMLVSGEFIEKPDFAQYNKVVVPEDEAYGANCIWVNGTVIVPEGYPTVLKAVQDLGYKTLVVDTSEYRKVDGGLSCLSLRF